MYLEASDPRGLLTTTKSMIQQQTNGHLKRACQQQDMDLQLFHLTIEYM
jgi:hypothetical protein